MDRWEAAAAADGKGGTGWMDPRTPMTLARVLTVRFMFLFSSVAAPRS